VTEVVKKFRGQRPLPLVRQVTPAEAFPVEALGEVLGSAARAIHDHVQSPLAICGQAVLAAATLAAQGHADVELATGQVKPLSNFYLTIAASGERKTATDSMALSPIRKHEAYLAEIYQAELPRFLNDKAAWEAARKKAIGSNKGNRSAIRSALDELGPEKLALRQAFDLKRRDRLALTFAGLLAERLADPKSPPCQASKRLGLPADFLYRSPAEQQRLLARMAPTDNEAPTADAVLAEARRGAAR
jgi:hypothetical protein